MFNTRGRFYSEVGERQKMKHHARYDDNGCVVLVEDGYDDLYAAIQSFAPSVDVHVILKRFVNGDASALSKRQGIYADLTGMPKTYAELLNTVNDLERQFLELPVDVREKFGNSFAQYAAQIGTPDYFQALGIVPAPEPERDVAIAKEVDINE